MVEQIGKSPEEITVLEGYRQAFLNVMASRGLTKDSIAAIETANCAAFLEAECDDEDGSINLPPGLETSFFAPYEGILAPEGQTQPLLVGSVALGLSGGRIEIEPKLIHYINGFRIEGYVTTTTTDAVSLAVSSEITLDFNKGVYLVGVVRIDGQARIIGEGDEEHKLTPDMMTNLTALLLKLNARQNSQVSIVKNRPANSPEYLVPHG